MILGFGTTETEIEQAECDRVDEFLRSNLDASDPMFTHDVVKNLKSMLREREKELRGLEQQYKTATDFPDRYSTFWFTVLDDASNIVVIFKFFHINRRHALSPDGWAALQTTKLHHVDTWKFRN